MQLFVLYSGFILTCHNCDILGLVFPYTTYTYKLYLILLAKSKSIHSIRNECNRTVAYTHIELHFIDDKRDFLNVFVKILNQIDNNTIPFSTRFTTYIMHTMSV